MVAPNPSSTAADDAGLTLAPLRRDVEFRKLWLAQTVSAFGTMLTRVALPLAAILALGSTPIELGALQVAEAIPVMLAGLVAGVWVDRLRRRPVMVCADLGRALALCWIPIAAFAGILSIYQLYAVTAIVAVLTALFDSAYSAYLPVLVGKDRIVQSNSRVTATTSAAEMAGFAAGGGLVQILGAPLAVLVDAVTFVVSAISIGAIRHVESVSAAATPGTSVAREAAAGLRVIWRDATLRALVFGSTTLHLFGGTFAGLYMLFAVRDLGLSAFAAGSIAACGGLGALGASAVAGRALERFGAKWTIAGGILFGGLFQCLVPLAHGSAVVAAAYLIAAQIFGDGLMTIALVNDLSLRQSIVPDGLLGRVSASARVMSVVALALGAIGGGVLGQLTSPRLALACGAIGLTLSSVWIAASPIREADVTSHPTAPMAS